MWKLEREAAEDQVRRIYGEKLGRDPLPADGCGVDYAAYTFVFLLMAGELDVAEVELAIANEPEAHRHALDVVHGLYLEELGRGIKTETGTLGDEAARPYVDGLRLGLFDTDWIRGELKKSDEYKERNAFRRARLCAVVDNVLLEPETGRASDELGISLFYALSEDVSREELAGVATELGRAQVEEVRLAGSTYTWGNPVGMRNVIPFRRGSTYVHRERGNVDDGIGVDPELDKAHAAELAARLELLVARGVRAQYTILWGGMQPLFTRGANNRPGYPPGEGGGYSIAWDRLEPYLEDVARLFNDHPEHTIEIINEADHGHHLARLGLDGRREFLGKAARIIRKFHPKAVITASDGGRNPQEEGDPYFAYHDVAELSYWNVHYPRDTVTVEGIPRWARGPWHLYQDRGPFRQAHGGRGGYGRNDENIFLVTKAQHDRWNYRGATQDWRMYGTMLWVSYMAGVPVTIHNFDGFFCRPGLTSHPIFRVVENFKRLSSDFVWHGATSYNAGWKDSPIREFRGPFKAFCIVSGQAARGILVTVLRPNRGSLELDLPRAYRYEAAEITGELVAGGELNAGRSTLKLGPTSYPIALVMRLWAKE